MISSVSLGDEYRAMTTLSWLFDVPLGWRTKGETDTICAVSVLRPRPCRVSVRDIDGVVHSVEVSGATLFEAAAQAVAVFEREPWAAAALTPGAALDVEVAIPAVTHRVPLSALRKWIGSPTTSPREKAIKQLLNREGG